MSYQVLARKWRPNKFAELVGQDHVVTAISHALDNDRLHHAYLFTGTRGVGKTTIARIFSKSLNCDEGQSAEPCGRCDTCLSIEQGNFVDLLEIDAASRTKVEDTRELLDNVQYKPTRGRFKVYLIDEVHMLSKHSFNALLKTLEEPPPHVKFLLATTDPQKLPVTILSRCLQFNLKALSREQIGKQLSYILGEENIQFEPAALGLLARAAQGSMRDALSLTDQAIAQGNNQVVKAIVTDMLGLMDKQLLLKLLNAVVEKQKSVVLQLVEQLSEQSPDYAQVLAELSSILHQIALTQWEPEACKLETTSARAIFAMAKKLTAEHVQLLYKITLEGVKEIPWSVDGRTCLEMTLLRMTSFAPTFTPNSSSGERDENNNERQQVIEQGPEDSVGVTAENSGLQTADETPQQAYQQISEENSQHITESERSSEQASPETLSKNEFSLKETTLTDVTSVANAQPHNQTFESQSNQASSVPLFKPEVERSEPTFIAQPNLDPATEMNATHLDVAHADTGHFDNRSQEQIAQDSFYDEHSVHHMEIEQQQLEQTKQAFYQPDALPTEQSHHQQLQTNVEQTSSTSEFEKTQALLALRKSLSESSEKQVPKKEGTTQVKKPLFPPKTLSNNRPEAEGLAPESFTSEPIASKLKAPEISIEQAGQSQPPPWELGQSNEQHDEQVESLSGNAYQQFSAEESLNNLLPESEATNVPDPAPHLDSVQDIPKAQSGLSNTVSSSSVRPSSMSLSGNIDTNALKPFLDSGEKLVHASQVNDWSAMIERSSLNGLDKQIALNATCVQKGDKLDLLVDKSQEHLISDASMAQLTESLSTLMGKALSVDIQLGDPSGTPSHIQEQITHIRQSHAEHVVKTDECIQSLISAFDGTVDTDSIRAR